MKGRRNGNGKEINYSFKDLIIISEWEFLNDKLWQGKVTQFHKEKLIKEERYLNGIKIK